MEAILKEVKEQVVELRGRAVVRDATGWLQRIDGDVARAGSRLRFHGDVGAREYLINIAASAIAAVERIDVDGNKSR